MIQLVQSIWLWAAAATAVPVFIHLWNIQQGKTLKVGSIAFLTESAKSHTRSVRLSELLLLLLRCLLLMVLALLLSKPLWKEQADPANKKGWVLIERRGVSEAYREYKPLIDSLLKAGYALHYFNKGFGEARFEDTVKTEHASVKESNESYWKLIKELNLQVPADLPVYVFTGNSLSRFTGSRPDVAMNLTWHTYTPTDTASTWLEKAYETITGSIRIIIANSNAGGTSFTVRNISRQTTDAMFAVSAGQGKTLVSYKKPPATTANSSIEVDTASLAVYIYTDRFSTDANYVKAALDAIRDFTQRKIKTTVVRHIEGITGKYDWLFWLSENPVPASMLKEKVLVYETGKVQQVHAHMVTGIKAGESSGNDLMVYKMIAHKSLKNAYRVWLNGYGDALLSRERSGATVYHFYSRFNPQWNELTWSSQFPQIIFNLIYNETIDDEMIIADKRIVDKQQILPATAGNEKVFQKEPAQNSIDLSRLCWIVAFTLFTLERAVSYRTKKGESYG